MARPKKTVDPVETPVAPQTDAKVLVDALVQAIQLTKPVEKKNAINRKPGSPWDPTDGTKKLKLKRKFYQHSIPIDPDLLTNEQIVLLNKLKPGRYINEWVKVIKRKDQGIDIDYPVRTASQRMKLKVNSFQDLLERIVAEAALPKKPEAEVEDED